MRIQNICILAKSIKNQGFCVAGIAVKRSDDGKWKSTGEWIRPISARPNGEISYQESFLDSLKRPLDLFDIVEIPLQKRASIAGQPEDWLIESNRSWIYKDKANLNKALRVLLESPDNLWHEQFVKIDRVTPEFVAEHNLPSLYMIKPEDFRLIVEEVNYGDGPKKKRRAVFKYNGKSYNLGMTDPQASTKYLDGFPDIPTGYVDGVPEDISAICVSLAPAWKGDLASQAYHYKLVAAIID